MTLPASGALLISLALVFLLGMAIQRGNTCTVVAVDDIVHRKSWDRFLAIASAWFLVAGGLVLMHLATGLMVKAKLFPVTVWSVAGGVLLGIGAVVNGACTTGTIARIGSGEYIFGLTILGFFLGCVLAPHIFGTGAITHVGSPATNTSLNHPLPTLILLVGVLAWDASRLIRGPHESPGRLRRIDPPRPAAATAVRLGRDGGGLFHGPPGSRISAIEPGRLDQDPPWLGANLRVCTLSRRPTC